MSILLIRGNSSAGGFMNYTRYLYWFIGLIILLFISVVITSMYVADRFSRRIVYKKPAEIVEQREQLITHFGAQPVTFATPGNDTIAALLVKRENAKRIFIIVHGFKHTKERMADFVKLFPHDTLLLIDLRGQGESGGQRIYLGLNEHVDLVTAVDYVKNTISAELPVIGIGVSQGGASLLRAAAAGAQFDAIIADSAPSEFKDVIACVLQETRNIPKSIGYLALWFYEKFMGVSICDSDYRAYAHAIECPVLIMHDLYDHLIDYSHAEKLYNALTCSHKQLYPVTGTRHGKMHKQIPDLYVQTIETFICDINSHPAR